jgi:hypothetical protein
MFNPRIERFESAQHYRRRNKPPGFEKFRYIFSPLSAILTPALGFCACSLKIVRKFSSFV